MSKPKVYIINKGWIGNASPNSNLGKNAYGVDTTVGLIEYEKDGRKKYMLVDPGMAASWKNIKKNLNKICELQDVTHILVTHWDQDHGQNLKEFSGTLCVSGAGTARVGTLDFGVIEDLYPNGYIEDENIKYQKVGKAHSRDEMIYIVDSENEGKIAFVGDLIWAPISEIPTEKVVIFDKGFSINVIKKYLFLEDLYDKDLDIEKLYVGHSGAFIDRQEFKKQLQALEGTEYKKLMREFIKEWEERIKEYKQKNI